MSIPNLSTVNLAGSGSGSTSANGMSLDLRSLDRLKSTASNNPQAGIKDAAKQLESLFMQELMKSMRASTMSTGMLDNAGSEMGTSMLDSQLATQMTGLPGGLGDQIARQLQRQMGIQGSETGDLSAQGSIQPLPVFKSPASTDNAAKIDTTNLNGRKLSASERFVLKHQDAAAAAQASSGIAASNILGQAALESGWGKHEIRMKDGTPSHNLFGIKATSGWQGKVAEVTTTEYIGGVARRVTAKFRAYDSYEDAFKDHAKLLTQNARYSQTVAQGDSAHGFARGLQKAGYATDPGYADKLTKVINTTLKVQRSVT